MNNNDWLDIDVLEDYLDGKLDAKTMYQIERVSLEDPFVAEALAGLSQSPKRAQSLSLLQKQLQERIAQKPIVQKRWRITSQRLSIASAAAVLFIAVSLLFWMKESRYREQQQAANANKNIEVAIASSAPVRSTQATPLDGWENYNVYLAANNRLTKTRTIGKSVTLTFIIDKEGRATEIKILKGVAKANDEEAIRLVKEGPKWNPLPEGDHTVNLEVQF